MADAIRPAVVFGDVHGQADQLRELIKIIRTKFGDEVDLYSLGDLFDRGPDSKEVIQICLDEKVLSIKGNHEDLIMELINRHTFHNFILSEVMGGKATLKSYGVDIYGKKDREIGLDFLKAMPQSHQEYVSKLPCYRRIKVGEQHYWLIHGGLQVSSAQNYLQQGGISNDDGLMAKISSKTPESLYWQSPDVRQDDNLYHFKDAIQIFGHRPVKSPIIREHFIAIDTGCGTCAPWNLSAVVLPTHEIISVPEVEEWV